MSQGLRHERRNSQNATNMSLQCIKKKTIAKQTDPFAENIDLYQHTTVASLKYINTL